MSPIQSPHLLDPKGKGKSRAQKPVHSESQLQDEVDKFEKEQCSNASDHHFQMGAFIRLAGTGCRCSWHKVFLRVWDIKFRSCPRSQAG